MSYHTVSHQGSPDAPVILALHGTGGDEHQFAGFVRQALPKAGLVSPRGDVSEHGANRFFKRTGEGVYDMDDLATRTRTMIDFVAAIRSQFAGRPLFAFGYSNGANILAATLFQQPDLFDKAALLHPLIPWTPAAQPGLTGVPVLITAGEMDPICPLPQSKALIGWFADQGADVTSLIGPGGHNIAPTELQALVRFLSD
ncbi:MAG: esterase [Paracoccus denitrificans]|nr:MAG: esterase [Paracoccus denitrificans]PZO84306.1 MAG: esterase [Paracoccus denitrificans]